jgi:membrane dipeptidase
MHVDHDEALRLHDDSVVVDGCGIMPLEEAAYRARLVRGGVSCVSYTVATPALGGDDLAGTARKVARMRQIVDDNPDELQFVTASAHIREAKCAGKLGMIMYLQDGRPIGEDVANVQVLHQLGVRVIQPVYTDANLIGSGCGEQGDGGLTFFGYQVLEELNRLRIMVDVSHIGDRTADDLIRNSRAPVVATHANARAVCGTARNKSDETICAIARGGGFIGVAIPSPLVSKRLPATLEDVLDHADHLLRLVGPEHVALGLDSCEAQIENPALRSEFSKRWHKRRPDVFGPESASGGYWPQPEGIQSVTCLRELTAGLAQRGHGDDTIRKVLGENWIRVAADVWGQ